MIRNILKSLEYLVLRWYAKLHLQQNRMLKLYKDGGITRDIANRELRSIYRLMRLSRFFENNIIILMSKFQSITIQR
ncbi:hypothetical protein EW093_00125 [Thiospirochaeta perfilievii]|uniref:Uncharacterized protein n=1 Tax=Thiospirochaeta perfilievii TaxID=252967 RepID=A0A5C1QAI7_9SPIO|nr:hypothetical protein [Thiospirochaeta perfilievii]QEN03172.1 hypothetical protein EW093_00125 [Thiospirochaeta perfilievii]